MPDSRKKARSREREQRIHVTAQSIAQDGHGIALASAPSSPDGCEYWVKNLVAGESAWVRVAHRSQHRGRAWADLVERTSAENSKLRAEPACPAFGSCGGCAWQHLTSRAQGQEKRAIVERALEAHLPASAIPSLTEPACGPALGYRNTGKYVVQERDGAVLLGAYKPRSHDVVSTLGCAIVAPAIGDVARHAAEALTKLGTPIFRSSEGKDGLRYLVLRQGAGAQVLAIAVFSSATPPEAAEAFAEALAAHPAVNGVVRCDNDSASGVLLTSAMTVLWGKGTVSERSGDVSIEIAPGAFWQLNRQAASRAFADIASSLGLADDARIVELYCGAGAISFALAKAGYSVVGIEKNSEAIESARRAAQAAGLTSVRFETADASLLEQGAVADADALVVDPPRKGLGAQGQALLVAAQAPVIAYLSCGPESFAKDLAALVQGGYTIDSIRLYDFMPGTSQVESLAILRR